MDKAFAFSTFEVKAFDSEQRTIEGWASTPELDRGGDRMSPEGARFSLPLPLLSNHQHDKPLGRVLAAQVSSKGIYIKAQIEKGGALLEYVDVAWAQIKSNLMRGLSIGWRPLERPELSNGSRLYKSWELFEVSTVVIPMNMGTTITAVKALSGVAASAAPGTELRISPSPGASGFPHRGTPMELNVSQQLTAAKSEHAAKLSRFTELETKDLTEGGLDATETSERDSLNVAVKALNSRIDRLATLEAAQAAGAKAITHTSPEAQRIHAPTQTATRVEVKQLPKGTLFTRYAMAVAAGKGSYSDTLAYAKRWEGETPEVVKAVQAMYGKATEGSTATVSPGWGGELVYQQNLAAEFIELLRPRTIMGRINGLRMVPFNVRIPRQVAGSTVNWVGQSAVKPVTELDFDAVTLTYHKVAGIVVLTEELVKLSTPSAEETVRRDLSEQIIRFLDQQFIDPNVTASANNPASITWNVSSPSASGPTAEDLYADMNTALATFDNAEVATDSIHIIMTPALARGISALRNALGQFEFPLVTMTGGTLMGFPVIVSNSCPAGTIVLVAASEILVADDGRVSLDASNQATLDMSGGSSPTFSLWQNNCIGIRAELFRTWAKRREESVAVIDTASYGPVPSE